ncbi:MAG: hypothetical protein FRX48_09319 [Lasallia pustulata]|uniref:Amine oxidase domain-containing protein n=1 Tax=Lasallia pustulata TaxID=136370 RepID=A0A5M8PC55_9LECA|nr:MAG: hypothetical protein FRX48_09319 [Lasallia pustulata]
MIRRILPKGRAPHICVVGAGMAGMRCAQVLSDKGMKVTVFEGRDRLGGRMQQSDRLGHWVDLGPNWIHGTDHNPFIDLAEETDTTTFSVPEKSALFDEFGHPLPEDKAAQYSEVVWGMISDAFKYSNEHSASIPQTRSLRDYLEERVKDKGLTKAEERIVLQMAEMWGAFVGDPLERQSLKFFWLEECIEGENLFVASTYKSILSHIATTTLAHTTVHLSTKVMTIESLRPPPNLPQPQRPRHHFHRRHPHLRRSHHDRPLGYLKRNLSTFVPPLPPASPPPSQTSPTAALKKSTSPSPTPSGTVPPPPPAPRPPTPSSRTSFPQPTRPPTPPTGTSKRSPSPPFPPFRPPHPPLLHPRPLRLPRRLPHQNPPPALPPLPRPPARVL